MSDLSDHGRTSHLSLIIVCVAVLVALSADNTGDAARAYQQLLVAERLADTWNGGWLEHEVESTIKRQPNPAKLLRSGELMLPGTIEEAWAGTGNIDPSFAVTNAWCLGRTLDVDDELPTIGASSLSTHFNLDSKRSVQIPVPGTYRIESLAEFARIWNLLDEAREVRYAEVLKEGYLIRRIQADTSRGLVTRDLVLKVSLNPEQSAFQSIAGVLPRAVGTAELLNRVGLLARIDDNPSHIGGLPAIVRRLIEQDARSEHYYLIERSGELILLRADAERINTDVQRAWRLTLPNAPPSGVYAESFPDLADHTKRVDSLDFSTLGQHLADEVARSRSDVDLGIAKMPNAALATWGLLLVIAVWVYVLLQIEAVRDENLLAVGWILFSQRRRAFLLATTSLTVLPTITVALLVVRGIENAAHAWVRIAVLIAACAAALVLYYSIRIIVAIPRLRTLRESRDVPSQ